MNNFFYRKGTSIRQAPVFSASQNITEKPMEVYYLDEWIIITLHVAGFLHPAIFWYFHHSSDKSGLKVTNCTVQSAEYWCFYGTLDVILCIFNIVMYPRLLSDRPTCNIHCWLISWIPENTFFCRHGFASECVSSSLEGIMEFQYSPSIRCFSIIQVNIDIIHDNCIFWQVRRFEFQKIRNIILLSRLPTGKYKMSDCARENF